LNELAGRESTSAAAGPTATALLGPDGPFARLLPGYEARAGQLEMATAVERTLTNDGILLCEAGTGTGKTLAYLLPAVLSGRKVIVSTATRALQEQIASHDVPLIARALGVEPRVAVMKGLANYVCRRRLAEFSSSADSLQPRHAAALNVVEDWLARSETGDPAEVESLPEDHAVWPHIVSSSDTRVGAACRYHEDCFVTRMRRAAERARIVVVNHHLFFADLALRGPHPGRVLPDYDAVIFDEAHQLEDTATLFFGFRISRARIESLLGDAAKAIDRAGDATRLGTSQGAGIIEATRSASERLWSTLRTELGSAEVRTTIDPGVWAGPANEAWLDLDEALEALGALAATGAMRAHQGEHADGALHADALEVVERRATTMRQQLAQIVECVSGHVAWFETDGKKSVLSAAPVDLSTTFRLRVFAAVPTAILTSATLTSTAASRETSASHSAAPGDFSFLCSRLGLADDLEIEQLVAPSPFDFASNALLYTPADLPEPQSPRFLAEAAERIEQLVELSDGGAFVLTTSTRSMHTICRDLRARCDGRLVLVQGDAPKQALIESFRSAGNAVLVATMSFWEGVDVPGRALRLVVLEKIPFPVPADPIIKARSLALEAEGRNAFMDFHVPSAAITLKQGFGRLIRTRADWGVVALLDNRIHRRGYGRRLLRALPPATRTDEIEVAREFLTRSRP
jgi:ATP-dependent DNA helicase DinG